MFVKACLFYWFTAHWSQREHRQTFSSWAEPGPKLSEKVTPRSVLPEAPRQPDTSLCCQHSDWPKWARGDVWSSSSRGLFRNNGQLWQPTCLELPHLPLKFPTKHSPSGQRARYLLENKSLHIPTASLLSIKSFLPRSLCLWVHWLHRGSACPCSYITFNTKDSCDLKRCWDSRHQTARLSILQQWTPAGSPRIPFTSDPACLELLEMPFALDCIDDASNILAIKWSSQNTLEFLIYSSVHITQESTEWHMRLYKICYRGLIKWFSGQSAHCSRMNSVWIPSTHGKAWSRGSQV